LLLLVVVVVTGGGDGVVDELLFGLFAFVGDDCVFAFCNAAPAAVVFSDLMPDAD
jgi:hypothetical protein